MKSIARHGTTRWLLLAVLAFSMIATIGCGPKPINRETLNYFYGLVNQQYWQRTASALALNDENGTEQLVVAPTGTSDKQQYVVFGDVTVTASNPKSSPTDALIKIKVFDGTAEKEVRVRVDDANLATLQKTLPEAFESKMQRQQRLNNEQYTAKIKEADSLLSANKVADAIAALKKAQAINDSNEVRTKLDVIYLKQGKYYYAQKKYDVAVSRLKLVSFDTASLAEARRLIPLVTADAAKAAADAAAAKAAAEKAAAAKVAAQKAAAEKAAAAKKAADQRRTWFKTLDDYYWALADLDAKCHTTSKTNSALYARLLSSVSLLNDKIGTYCSGHAGMNPTELDNMRKQLASYSANAYSASHDYFYTSTNDWYQAYNKAQVCRKEYLRLRTIVVQRFGY
jgi:hypothetical protein